MHVKMLFEKHTKCDVKSLFMSAHVILNFVTMYYAFFLMLK